MAQAVNKYQVGDNMVLVLHGIAEIENDFNPSCANRNKSRLLFSSAEMFKKLLWQTVWTQIRLLLWEQSVLGPRCLLLYLIYRNVRQLFAADDISYAFLLAL